VFWIDRGSDAAIEIRKAYCIAPYISKAEGSPTFMQRLAFDDNNNMGAIFMPKAIQVRNRV